MELVTKTENKPGPKLTVEAQELVVLRLAEFIVPEEIKEEIAKVYQIDISAEGIRYYKKERQDLVKAKRDELNLHLEENYALANKSLRLKALQKDYDKIEYAKDLPSIEQKRRQIHEIQDLMEPRKVDVTSRPGERVLTDEELERETRELGSRFLASEQAECKVVGEQLADILAEDKTEGQERDQWGDPEPVKPKPKARPTDPQGRVT